MIRARFLYSEEFQNYSGFIVSGHAEGDYGKNILCAGVSSATMLATNILSEYSCKKTDIKSEMKIRVKNNAAGVLLKKPCKCGSEIIKALKTHFELLNCQKDLYTDKNGIYITVYYI